MDIYDWEVNESNELKTVNIFPTFIQNICFNFQTKSQGLFLKSCRTNSYSLSELFELRNIKYLHSKYNNVFIFFSCTLK